MLTQIQFYFDVVQAYFGTAVAILFIIQPVTIPLSSLFHALEVQARLRGWNRVQPVAYWLAKAFGTCAAIDLRNIQRVGGKFFTIAWEVLTKIIAACPASKASKNKAVVEAMKDPSRTLLVLLSLGSVLPLQGCVGTFEEARLAQPAAVKASPVRLSANRCETLSDREYWFGITSIATGSTGAGAVLAVLPTPDDYQTTLLIAGASAAAVSVVSGLASSKAGAAYVAEGCAK